MKKAWSLPAIAALVLVGGYYAWTVWRPPLAERPAAPANVPVPPAPLPAPPAAPQERYPIATSAVPAQAEAPLPALDESDAAFGAAVAQLLGAKALPAYLYPDRMIRRLVATVDNLPRQAAPARMLPWKPVPGAFRVERSAAGTAIDPLNAARYGLCVEALRGLDAKAAVDLYVRYYPLFQRAYNELGYPKGHFNDRLVEALDDLLAAPDPAPPVALVQPRVLYQFADPELEARSAGQKMMMRMGAQNAAQARTVLREIRSELMRRVSRR
ncbi:MAG TPA: DUF3014 domain-containing protein [Rhodocyclaceae bacterium]